MTRALLVLLVLAALGHADDAPPLVTVHAEATPDTTTVGSRVRYEVTVSAPPGVEIVVAQPAEKIGDMDIIDFGSEPPAKTPDGRIVFKRWWQLVAWTPGNHLLPSPEVRHRPSAGELVTAPGDDIGVTVESLLARAPEHADIRDIKAPDPIPIDWRPYYWAGGALAALLVLALVARRLLRRQTPTTALALPLSPHLIARAALDALRARGLVEHGAFKEFYSALSDIVRRYLEDRFRVRAPEMTTEEFLAGTARDGRLGVAHRRLLGEFLVESDLVKFARHLPTIADSERAFDAARRFVDDTVAADTASTARERATV